MQREPPRLTPGDLPPYYRVLSIQPLTADAEIVILQRQYLLTAGPGGELMRLESGSICALYREPGLIAPLDC